MLRKLSGLLGCGVLHKVGRARTQDTLRNGQLLGEQLGALDAANPDRQIKPLGHQVYRPVGQVQLDGNAGMGLVLIVITNVDKYKTNGKPTGYWVAEVAQPLDVLTKAGLTVDFASVQGGKVPVEPTSDPRNPKSYGGKDLVSLRFVKDAKLQKRLTQTAKLSEVDLSGYSAVLFAGGTGAAFDYPEDATVRNAARTLYEQHKIVAAVCHGTAALLNVKLADGSYLLKGNKATGFSNKEEEMAGNLQGALPMSIEDEMKKRGASYSAVAPWQPNAIQDGNLITGQQPQSAHELAEKMVAALTAKP